jgi:hypothetical protein
MMRVTEQVRGVEGVWWSPRSSKPLRPDRVGLGGFDSHTLPPACRRVRRALYGLLLLPAMLAAQSVEDRQVGARALATPDSADQAATPRAPITPRRAFLASLLLPGAGQAKLDRPFAGGLFLLVEAAALTMVHRSAEDLRIARRFAGDSVPLTYQTDPVTGVVARDPDGRPIVATWERSRYTLAAARTRRLHLEDWTAVLIFNHLFAGADAFVAAQLWDLPERLEVRQTPGGLALIARIPFGAAPRR